MSRLCRGIFVSDFERNVNLFDFCLASDIMNLFILQAVYNVIYVITHIPMQRKNIIYHKNQANYWKCLIRQIQFNFFT